MDASRQAPETLTFVDHLRTLLELDPDELRVDSRGTRTWLRTSSTSDNFAFGRRRSHIRHKDTNSPKEEGHTDHRVYTQRFATPGTRELDN